MPTLINTAKNPQASAEKFFHYFIMFLTSLVSACVCGVGLAFN